uniref:Glycerol-3-phosphate dehydrogenase [NAD(+)] n=1 Tax=Chromera velia CCMP2878 TaxID=1169474 RepID=A0A0G4HPR8_9ALVE|eukprot:Cvel_29855.t1-p1 / transcript=Cvel_29855.t1 / gene=Cvel_29855 / organism=Chromera_velia_CCMP2878 / gene_product=Glycerol-3-phosphate dehydrogenase [NAD(P) ], putative / transcript_product=Glycerol-3-phosphate dehydrogenase [NAD(P) ], putative / location=Cvel_scaffold4164:4745-8066(+) / protein_length=372 / sequence_SO=supercontig / SO=protein_coding / is_pseudo=false
MPNRYYRPSGDRDEYVGVLGGGAFGSAMAFLLARKGFKVRIWARESEVVEAINTKHENVPFFPGVQLPETVEAVSEVTQAAKETNPTIVLLAIPTPFLRSFVVANREAFPVKVPIVCLSKGIENESLCLPLEILLEELPGKYHKFLSAVSGPSFAKEIAQGKPTSVSCAAYEKAVAEQVQQMLSDSRFRLYTTQDCLGVELCGAVKNVLAIASGACDRLGYGDVGRAALITRGLAEISRLACKKGASPLTMMGLAGVGDLVLTCSGSLSRNFQVGRRLAGGETLEQIVSSVSSVAEGVATAKSVMAMASKLGVDMPICKAVHDVLYQGRKIADALEDLVSRPLKEEVDQAVMDHLGAHHGHPTGGDGHHQSW